MLLKDGSGESRVADTRGASAGGHLAVAPADRDAQEDTVRLDWTGPASFIIGGRPADFEREAHGDMALALEYRVLAAGDGPVTIAMATSPESFAALDLREAFSANVGGEWQTGLIKLSCFAARGVKISGWPVNGTAVVLTPAGQVTRRFPHSHLWVCKCSLWVYSLRAGRPF